MHGRVFISVLAFTFSVAVSCRMAGATVLMNLARRTSASRPMPWARGSSARRSHRHGCLTDVPTASRQIADDIPLVGTSKLTRWRCGDAGASRSRWRCPSKTLRTGQTPNRLDVLPCRTELLGFDHPLSLDSQ